MLAWRGRQAARRRAAAATAAWETELTVDREHFTRFQRLAEAAVLAHLAAQGERPTRQVRLLEGESGEPQTYVTLSVGSRQLTVELYDDQVNVHGAGVDARIERWGVDTPAEARRTALAAVDQVLAAANAPAP